MGFHVGAKYGVHAGLIASPLCLEPVDDVLVEPKTQVFFTSWRGHHDTRVFPKILVGFSGWVTLQLASAGPALSPRNLLLNLI